MRVTDCAISINVADPEASAAFVRMHFGFGVVMSADGFVSLRREDVGYNLIFLKVGLGSFKPQSHAGPVQGGLLVVFVVDDLDDEFARLEGEGVPVATPPQTESWGERFCQFRDPNGVLYQLVQWV